MDRPTLTVALERRFGGGPTVAATFDLDLGAGHVLVLFGPSGAGKTTVLRALAGLERPDDGRISVAGETWFDAGRGTWLAPQRRRVGFLPQGYALFPHLDVRGNLGFGLRGPGPARRARVAELTGLLQLEGLERRRPAQLSGGQQQRVALGRALAPRPRLLLLDEPLSALDEATRTELRGELRRILVAGGTPAVLVTHDRTEALALADRVGVMIDGVLRQEGPTLDVFDRPADEAVARVVGVETVARGLVVEADGALCRVEVGTARLTAVGDALTGTGVLVSIRAEDVLLERLDAGGRSATSARNHLRGSVVRLDAQGPLVRARLDCGFELAAVVTRPAAEDLELRVGLEVGALFKASAVHLIPAVAPAAPAAPAAP